MGKADLHLHSNCNDGVDTVAAMFEWVQEHTDLDVISITDHDIFEAQVLAEELCQQKKYRFEYVKGAEMTTLRGHLLALFINKPIETLLPVEDTVRLIHEQGGLAIIPHPMSMATYSIGESEIEKVMRSEHPLAYFDGIETINPSVAGRIVHKQVREKNKKWNLARFAGSDGHMKEVIGDARTLFDGQSANDFRAALLQKRTRVSGHYHGFKPHFDLFWKRLGQKKS